MSERENYNAALQREKELLTPCQEPERSSLVDGEGSMPPREVDSAALRRALGEQPIVFGLRAQGHIPTVKRMLAKGASWDEIGKEIGWHGPTVRRFYEEELRMSDEVRVVQWVDSAAVNGGMWVARDEINPDVMTNAGLTQRTVGWVIDESDEVLLLAQSIGPDRLGAVLAIPKAAIRV